MTSTKKYQKVTQQVKIAETLMKNIQNTMYTKHKTHKLCHTKKVYTEQTIYATTKNQTQRIVQNNTTK